MSVADSAFAAERQSNAGVADVGRSACADDAAALANVAQRKWARATGRPPHEPGNVAGDLGVLLRQHDRRTGVRRPTSPGPGLTSSTTYARRVRFRRCGSAGSRTASCPPRRYACGSRRWRRGRQRTREAATDPLPAADVGPLVPARSRGAAGRPQRRARPRFRRRLCVRRAVVELRDPPPDGRPVPAPVVAVLRGRRPGQPRQVVGGAGQAGTSRPRPVRHRLESPAHQRHLLGHAPRLARDRSCSRRSPPTMPPSTRTTSSCSSAPPTSSSCAPETSATSNPAGCCTRCSATPCCSATGRRPPACGCAAWIPPPGRSPRSRSRSSRPRR